MASGTEPLIPALIYIKATGSLLTDEESLWTHAQKTALCVRAATAKAQRCALQTLISIYTGGLGVIQAVSLITVAGVTLSCVVTNPLATNIRVDLTLVHLG